jgi:hypothetical protein
MKAGHRGRGAKEVMSMILGISSIADLCLLFKLPQIAGGNLLSRRLHSCLPSFPPEAGVRPSTGVPWKIFFRPHSPNPARPNPSDINIPGVKPGPRAPATSASNEFVPNVTSTPPVRVPNSHFTIMIAPSCQYVNPGRQASVPASVRNACRCLSDFRPGDCPMVYSGTKGISYPSPQGDRAPSPSVATSSATRCSGRRRNDNVFVIVFTHDRQRAEKHAGS